MKKIILTLSVCIMCFAFCGNVIAEDIPGAQPPPEEIQRAIVPTKVEIQLNNKNKPVIVQITDNKGVVVFETITTASSIKIDAKYLQEDAYCIAIIPCSKDRR